MEVLRGLIRQTIRSEGRIGRIWCGRPETRRSTPGEGSSKDTRASWRPPDSRTEQKNAIGANLQQHREVDHGE